MPIYEYKCTSCGHKKEVLQKMSDAPLKECPACGKLTLSKLISAAGFHLKGSGWYATDFKGASKSVKSDREKEGGKVKEESKPDDGSHAKDDSKAKNDGSRSSDGATAKVEAQSKEATKSDAPASSSAVSPSGQ